MAQPDQIWSLQGDVSAPQQLKQKFQDIERKFGRLDILFNNAGIGVPPVPLNELSIADWQSCVDVNLTGSFLGAKYAFQIMKNQSLVGGRIINNGSISAHAPRPYSAPYTATKHAITDLTKRIALDARPYNIACSQIDIGNADTNLTHNFKTGVSQASGDIKPKPTFSVEQCGEAVAYMVNLPLDTNVQFMVIMATKMPYIGRG